jgi:RNA polymerase sigma factor (sigma-70 family)
VSNRTILGLGRLLRVIRSQAEGKTDGQLLEQFLLQRDETAFTTLVQRHGPMVLGVCRRILENATDAEDAFQATFLVLVRKASSLTGYSVLGGFLHEVARRTALKARSNLARRRVKEQAMARPEAQGEAARDDWLPLLDEELDRLPEKYRLPLVLCDLEGRTRQEAAEQLGWPEGTVAGRLARARELLARKLSRHGRAVSAGSLAAVLAPNVAPACVPPALVESTVKAATLMAGGQAAAVGVISAEVAWLTEGVVNAMLVSKLKMVLVAVTLVVLSGAALGYGALAGRQPGARGEGTEASVAPHKAQPLAEVGAREQLAQGQDQTPPPGGGQDPDNPRQESGFQLAEKLERPIQFHGVDDPKVTLAEALEQFDKRYSLTFTVNEKAFQQDQVMEVLRTEFANPNPVPAKPNTTLATVLRIILSRLPDQTRAMYVIRDREIEITTVKAVRKELGRGPREPIPPLVYLQFHKQPIEQAMQTLSDRTGVTLVLDPRAGDKTKTLVSGSFKSVPLDSVVQVLTDMGDLKPVKIDNMYYLTSPENAERLLKEQSKRKAAP